MTGNYTLMACTGGWPPISFHKAVTGFTCLTISLRSRCLWKRGGQVCRTIVPDLLHELGSLETLRKRNKIYCVDDGVGQYGLRADTPLPLAVPVGKSVSANIYIGDDPKKDKPEEAILFLRTEKPAQFKILVNDELVETQKPEYVKRYNRDTNLKEEQKIYAWVLPASCLKHGDNEISFLSLNGIVTVKRLEVALKYGDVKTEWIFLR